MYPFSLKFKRRDNDSERSILPGANDIMRTVDVHIARRDYGDESGDKSHEDMLYLERYQAIQSPHL